MLAKIYTWGVDLFRNSNDAARRRTRPVDTTPALSVTNAFGYAHAPVGCSMVTTETTEHLVNALNQHTNILCVPASLRLNCDAFGATVAASGPLVEGQKGSCLDIRHYF